MISKTLPFLIVAILCLQWAFFNEGYGIGKKESKKEIVTLQLSVTELGQKVETLGKLASLQDYQIDVLSQQLRDKENP